MAAKAGIHVTVSCSAEPGSEGLDMFKDVKVWLSYQWEDDPTHHVVRVDLLGQEFHAGRSTGCGGDDAVDLARKLSEAITKETGGQRAGSVRIGTTSITSPGKGGKKPTESTTAFIEFDNVEAMDIACCDHVGKVRIGIYGNLQETSGSKYHLGGKADLIPADIFLFPKEVSGTVGCPDSPPPTEGPPNPPGGPKRPPVVTPVTPGPPPTPWEPPPPAPPRGPTTLSEPPPSPPPPPPAAPPAAPPAVPGMDDAGDDEEREEEGSGTGGGMQRVITPADLSMGVFHLASGSNSLAENMAWRFIPWRVIRTTPLEQLEHMRDCLLAGGIDCLLREGRLAILGDVRTGLPIVAFKITINYAGRGFPWHWNVDMWRSRAQSALPAEVRIPRAEPIQLRTAKWSPLREVTTARSATEHLHPHDELQAGTPTINDSSSGVAVQSSPRAGGSIPTGLRTAAGPDASVRTGET